LAVHRGQTYNSGHYYAYVNTGPDYQRPHWCQFNDSLVSPASEQAALSFTGGKKRTIAWSSQYERWI
jgi:ubiquitin C-terminal hydrolase